MKNHFSVRRLCLCSMLLAAALIMFTIEAQLPPVVPIPGVKLGLANVVTLTALYLLSAREAFLILLLRVFLSAVFSASFSAIFYSLTGGVLAFAVMVLIRAMLRDQKIWLVSLCSGIAHNIGQLLAASAILKSAAVWWYFPALLIAGAIAGFFVGMASAGLISVKHIRRLFTDAREQG